MTYAVLEEVDLHITVSNVGLPRNPIFWTYNVLVASPRYRLCFSQQEIAHEKMIITPKKILNF